MSDDAGRDVDVLREELDHITSLANMLCEAWRDPHSAERLAQHRIMEGVEFAVMRAAWLLGEREEAARIHKLIGDHSPHACPCCLCEWPVPEGVAE